MHNDPHAYLSGIFKNVSKGQEAAEKRVSVNGHSRSMPKRSSAGGSTGVQAPDGQPNPAMVQAAPHKKLDETRAGAATIASRKTSGAKASSASHEAGESAAYEKMEEKTLKGLKGSKEKVLSEGHNTKKSMKLGGGGRFEAIEKKAAASGAKNPAAVAASAGIKKYGKAKMAKMAAAGRKK